jgi:hypothetical protein
VAIRNKNDGTQEKVEPVGSPEPMMDRVTSELADKVAARLGPIEARVAEEVLVKLADNIVKGMEAAAEAIFPKLASQAAEGALQLIRAEATRYTAAVAGCQAAIDTQLREIKKMSEGASVKNSNDWKEIHAATADLKRMHQGYWRYITERVKDVKDLLGCATENTLARIVQDEVEDFQLEQLIRGEIRDCVRAALRGGMAAAKVQPAPADEDPEDPSAHSE